MQKWYTIIQIKKRHLARFNNKDKVVLTIKTKHQNIWNNCTKLFLTGLKSLITSCFARSVMQPPYSTCIMCNPMLPLSTCEPLHFTNSYSLKYQTPLMYTKQARMLFIIDANGEKRRENQRERWIETERAKKKSEGFDRKTVFGAQLSVLHRWWPNRKVIQMGR